LNSDSTSFQGIFLGIGLEAIRSKVFRCLLFMMKGSTAALQVKSARVEPDLEALLALGQDFGYLACGMDTQVRIGRNREKNSDWRRMRLPGGRLRGAQPFRREWA
jgi:hypothetical protein